MIIDRLENAGQYFALHPMFSSAFAFLLESHLASMAPGRYPIEGDEVYAVVMDGKGKGLNGASLEAHRKYIDIQMTISGDELIGWRSLASCSLEKDPYNETKDIIFFQETYEIVVPVPAGMFTIFFPHDTHAPMMGAGDIRKVVVKVRIG